MIILRNQIKIEVMEPKRRLHEEHFLAKQMIEKDEHQMYINADNYNELKIETIIKDNNEPKPLKTKRETLQPPPPSRTIKDLILNKDINEKYRIFKATICVNEIVFERVVVANNETDARMKVLIKHPSSACTIQEQNVL